MSNVVKQHQRMIETWLWVLSAILFLLILLFCPDHALGQAANASAVSFGPVISPYTTISANAPYRVCAASATGVPCSTTGVTIYSDINLTHVQSNPSFANSQGIVNFFIPSGFYKVQLNPVPGQTYTYYVFPNGGGGGSGGPTIQTNSVNNLSQTLLNFTNSTGIIASNPSGGIEQMTCNTSSAAGSIGCYFIPLTGSGAPTAACSSANSGQEYYDLNSANAYPQIYICKQYGISYIWQALQLGAMVYPGAGVPNSSGSSWLTSFGIQGSDTNVLTSGIVSGALGSLLCVDGNGGATTGGCAIPPSVTFELNGSSTGVNQMIWNANDTFPAAPTGNQNVTWQHDQATGSWSAYVPIPTLPLQMYPVPPDTNQGVFVPFTVCTKNPDNVALLVTQYCDAKSGYQQTIPGGLFDHLAQPSITWSGASLPAGINPANVTGVYGMVWTGVFNISYNLGCNVGSLTASSPNFTEQTTLLGSATGSNIGTITCTMQQSQSVLGDYGATQMAQIGLWVEYTGTPVTSPNYLNIGPYLVYNSALNELTTSPFWPNGTNSLTVAQMNSVYPPHYNPGFLATVSDLQAPTGVAAGSGTLKGQILSDGTNYNVYHDTFGIPQGGTGVCPSNPDGSLSNLNCNFGGTRTQPSVVSNGLIPGVFGGCSVTATLTAGNALLVYLSSSTTAPTDTAGDTFSLVYTLHSSLDSAYIATNIVGGSTTISAMGGGCGYGGYVEIANADATTPIDGTPITVYSSTEPAFYNLGPITTTGGGDLLMTQGYGTGCGATGPAVTNFTGLPAFAFSYAFYAGAASKGNYNALWYPGCASSGQSTFTLVAIKGKAGGGGGGGTIPATTQMLAGDGTGNATTTHMDDGHTTAGTITSTEPIQVNDGSGFAGAFKPSVGTDPGGAAGTATYTTDATNGYAEVREGTAALSRVCTAANGVCVTSGSLAPSVTYNVATGVIATPAGPYILAPTNGTVSHCYFTTQTSDGATALTFNVKFNGVNIISGTNATVAAGTVAGTISTFTLTSGTIAITQGQKWEFDISSGTANWTGAMQCF